MHMTCESYAKEEERIKKSLNKMIITIGKKELKYNTMISEESFFETTRNINLYYPRESILHSSFQNKCKVKDDFGDAYLKGGQYCFVLNRHWHRPVAEFFRKCHI